MASNKQIEKRFEKAAKQRKKDLIKYDKPLGPSEKQIPIETYIAELPSNIEEDTIDWQNHILTWKATQAGKDYFMWFDLDTKFIGWEEIKSEKSARYHKRIHNIYRFKQAMKDWDREMHNWDWQYKDDAL